jgi:pimeloyl-ACP methyl ester carboxylesterase
LVVFFACSATACADTPRGEESESIATSAAAESAADDHGAAPAIHSVSLSTGVTLSYLEQGRKNGKVLVLLHGYTDSHHSWDLDLPRIPRSYHVYALDQRGHGDSSKPACCYTQADFAADVAAFMDAVHVPRATLVGHSMGSFIAQQVALDHPSRVERLVLVGSAPTVAGNPVALGFKEAVDTLTDPIDPAFVRDFQSSTFYRPIPPEYLDTAVAESLKVPATVWKQALDGLLAEDHTSRLHEIAAPTLIYWGDQDIFFGAAEQATLDALIPDSTLLVYPQTGHGLHAEQPQRFVRDLTGFVR